MLCEVLAEAVEALLPAGAPLGDPALGGAHGYGLDGAGAHAPLLAGSDEAAVFEHVQVLHDGGERHGERLGQLADGGGAAAEAIDHCASAGIGEGTEDKVDLPVDSPVCRVQLLKHLLKYVILRRGMRAHVQRVSRASVRVDGRLVSEIGEGLLVALGVTHDDDAATARRLADKVGALRIFADADGHMNEALGERAVLCVSQFTLYGDARRGNRPSFMAAARPEQAEPLYELFCERIGALRGVFGAHMEVELVNDGPVTLLLEA
jgi:D-aminoacyl-tRNA deacylase